VRIRAIRVIRGRIDHEYNGIPLVCESAIRDLQSSIRAVAPADNAATLDPCPSIAAIS
jgi:hypothetical protein